MVLSCFPQKLYRSPSSNPVAKNMFPGKFEILDCKYVCVKMIVEARVKINLSRTALRINGTTFYKLLFQHICLVENNHYYLPSHHHTHPIPWSPKYKAESYLFIKYSEINSYYFFWYFFFT